ncbi:MAG: hypothetical protein GY696_29240 [Gammaproteobacteria bacterium]|nr:hypothetical protein [Gammaproteobacteria bacterium]
MDDSIKPSVWPRRFAAKFVRIPSQRAAVLGFAALSRLPFGLAVRALTAHPPNWIQTNLATTRRTKPAGLIESRSIFLSRISRGYQLAQLPRNATIWHLGAVYLLGGSHMHHWEVCIVGQTIAAARTLNVARKGPPGDWRFRLPALDHPT